MEKFFKNIQWVIVLGALYNLYNIYEENDAKPEQARAQTEKLRQKLVKNKKVKKEIDEFYKNIEEAKLKIQKVKESVEQTQQLLPADISDLENMTLLRRTAEELNIKTTTISPGAEEVKGLFITKKYKFSTKASYVQFLVLFERISNNKRVLNIRDLSLNKADSAQRSGTVQLLTGSFSLEAYRFNPNYKDPDAQKDESPLAPLPPPPKTSSKANVMMKAEG